MNTVTNEPRGAGALPDAARWRAISARDAAVDGAFFYAVTTTGVYCRPTCPSRRPRPGHVRCFDTVDAAERARVPSVPTLSSGAHPVAGRRQA